MLKILADLYPAIKYHLKMLDEFLKAQYFDEAEHRADIIFAIVIMLAQLQLIKPVEVERTRKELNTILRKARREHIK